MSDPHGHAGSYHNVDKQGANGWRQGTYNTSTGVAGHHDHLHHTKSGPTPYMSPDSAGQGSSDMGSASHQHFHHANTFPKVVSSDLPKDHYITTDVQVA